MSKALNKAQKQRVQRRALNKALDFFRGISGRRLASTRYGDGLRRGQLKEDLIHQTLEDERDAERHLIDF